jgi:hypothetical protein
MVFQDDMSFSNTLGYGTLLQAATLIVEALENGVSPSPSLFEDNLFLGSPVADFVQAFGLSTFEHPSTFGSNNWFGNGCESGF